MASETIRDRSVSSKFLFMSYDCVKGHNTSVNVWLEAHRRNFRLRMMKCCRRLINLLMKNS